MVLKGLSVQIREQQNEKKKNQETKGNVMQLKKPETTTANFSSHLKGLGGCQVMGVGQKDSAVVQWNHACFGIRGVSKHEFEFCPRSECRLGFLTRGNGFLAGGL
ncbi:hypothetical protein E2C01_031700 [Portunus trituberculatus]|uniref:Uncharacterized protein n=1 Tax=Portunus trituberculatus TaxID=210409 RepID=A0A5B7EYB5_PORTR|nr:hypothetical protein [Portunus trituberculatus]